jgi:hypothetical protein
LLLAVPPDSYCHRHFTQNPTKSKFSSTVTSQVILCRRYRRLRHQEGPSLTFLRGSSVVIASFIPVGKFTSPTRVTQPSTPPSRRVLTARITRSVLGLSCSSRRLSHAHCNISRRSFATILFIHPSSTAQCTPFPCLGDQHSRTTSTSADSLVFGVGGRTPRFFGGQGSKSRNLRTPPR